MGSSLTWAYDQEREAEERRKRVWEEYGVTLTSSQFATVHKFAKLGRKIGAEWASNRTLEEIVNEDPDLGIKWTADESGNNCALKRSAAITLYDAAASYLRRHVQTCLLLEEDFGPDTKHLESILLEIAEELNGWKKYEDEVRDALYPNVDWRKKAETPGAYGKAIFLNNQFYVGCPKTVN